MATAQSYQAPFIDTSLNDVPSGDYGDTWFGKLVKNFGGPDWSTQYQNALTENNRRYEQAMIQQQRDYETWYDSTAVQRRVDDIKAAGLNPWLALQSGGISANGSSTTATQPGAGSSAKKAQSSKGSSALAMMLFATARLIAAL